MCDPLLHSFHLTPKNVVDLIEQNSHLCFMLIGPDGQINSCSPVLQHWMKRNASSRTDLSLEAFFGKSETVDSLVRRFSECRASSLSHYPTVTLRTSSGEKRYSRYLISKQNLDGKPMYLLVLLDVDMNRELSLLQRFAGTLMRDINLGVLLIDTQFTLVDISDMACNVLGLEREKIIYKSMEEVFANVPIEYQLVQRTILDGVVVRNHAVSWMNGQNRYELLLDSNLLKDEFGEVVGAYIIFKDVTNLRSLEEQVQRSDRLAMIGQIAAGTAHEIRNPLTSIKGFMQVLKNTFMEKGMEKEIAYTDIMLSEINRINELVSEFLLLGKRKNVSFEKVELHMVLKDILPIIHNEALLHGVTVNYNAMESLPHIIADGELLKQVFLNICKNGIEAMSEGGELTVTEKVDMSAKRVEVEIRDTGPGIPSFLLDKIFDPFFTTKENGTGLGLSVCQRIIHDLGGTIRVSSKGYGTTFTVCIPYP